MPTLPINALGLPFGGRIVIDPNAKSYIEAEGITDPTVISAINNLVIDLKAINSVEAGFVNFDTPNSGNRKVIYPFPGTGALNTLNLLNPVDSDAAFRMVNSAAPTISSNGVNWDGTKYADTKINPSTLIDIDDTSANIFVSVENRVTTANVYEFGSVRFPRTYYAGIENGATYAANCSIGGWSPTAIAGIEQTRSFFRTEKIGAASGHTKMYKNRKNILTSVTVDTQTAVTDNMFLGARNNSASPDGYSDRTFGYWDVGKSITGTALPLYNEAITRYLIAMGRLASTNHNFIYYGHSWYGESINDGSIPDDGIAWSIGRKSAREMIDDGIYHYDYNSQAIGGATIATLITFEGTYVTPFVIDSSYVENYVVLEAGLNDMSGGETGANAYADLKAWVQSLISSGYKVLALTQSPIDGNATYNTQKDIFNGLMRTDLDLLTDAYTVDLDNIPEMLDPSDTAWYNADGVHPMNSLKIKVGEYVFNYFVDNIL
jgi:hypothetical protein